MAVVDRSCTLDAPAEAVWGAVLSPATFLLVARGVLTMPVLRGRTSPWRVGEVVTGRVLLGGVVPLSRHRIRVREIDVESRRLATEESGGVLERWDHTITVEPLGEGSCRYRDVVEIDAGAFTGLVAAWASAFYRLRQRRWREVAPVLAAAAPEADHGQAD